MPRLRVGGPGITIYAATIADVELDDFSAGNLTVVTRHDSADGAWESDGDGAQWDADYPELAGRRPITSG